MNDVSKVTYNSATHVFIIFKVNIFLLLLLPPLPFQTIWSVVVVKSSLIKFVHKPSRILGYKPSPSILVGWAEQWGKVIRCSDHKLKTILIPISCTRSLYQSYSCSYKNGIRKAHRIYRMVLGLLMSLLVAAVYFATPSSILEVLFTCI